MGYNLYELLLPLKKYKGYWHIHNDQAWFYENQELVDLFQDGECMKTGEFFSRINKKHYLVSLTICFNNQADLDGLYVSQKAFFESKNYLYVVVEDSEYVDILCNNAICEELYYYLLTKYDETTVSTWGI